MSVKAEAIQKWQEIIVLAATNSRKARGLIIGRCAYCSEYIAWEIHYHCQGCPVEQQIGECTYLSGWRYHSARISRLEEVYGWRVDYNPYIAQAVISFAHWAINTINTLED